MTSDERLLHELEQIVEAARQERDRRKAERRAALRDRVAAYLAEHPDASANAVRDEVGGRKRDVLLLVRELRQAVPVSPEPAQEGEAP